MGNKKLYVPPRLTAYHPNDVPEWLTFVPDDLRAHVPPIYTTVVDQNRNYIEVSASFCELLGYRREELIGKKYDEITAPETSDIPTIFNLFKKLGYMQGLWMLVSRKGERIVIRYESWLRTDSFIESNIEVVDHLR